MKKYYIAVTYDVCEHNSLYEDMNYYPLESSIGIEDQIKVIAKSDVASLVKVYESDTSDFKETRLFQEYTFKEYECSCNKSNLQETDLPHELY
ncbi:hypothetical protein [Fredinandcohnia sp. 179-A 10B2 NHS]|uniref:hypothetical protein n=1 Tax=Fredinandcohnia sp. 179-A 10B2 NHS TaxID=3235176 RepID=UPI0039A17090